MEREEDLGCEAPTKVVHRLRVQTRKLWVMDFGRKDLAETRAVYQEDGVEGRGWHTVVLPVSPTIRKIVVHMRSSCSLIQPPALSRNAFQLYLVV